MKILLVSWSVYPDTGGSTIIVNNVAKAFSKDEMVLVGEASKNEADHWPEHLPRLYHIAPSKGIMGRGQKYTNWLVIGRITRELKAIAQKEECTHVLAVFPDEVFMYAAYRVSKKLGLPFYTWFHNTYETNRHGILKKLAQYLQPRFFAHAKVNFVMSDGMRRLYADLYPHQEFNTLVHGFEIPRVIPRPGREMKKPVKFLFSGSLNKSCEDAAGRLFKVISENPDYELHLYGNPDAFKGKVPESDNVYMHGFVPLEVLEERQAECDVVLLPHGFEGLATKEEYQTIFPTKTIPLLYSGKPILAHSPHYAFLTTFLKERGCAVVVDQKDEEIISTKINELNQDYELRRSLVQKAIETSGMFDLEVVQDKIRRTLRDEYSTSA